MRARLSLEIGLVLALVGVASWAVFYGRAKGQEATKLEREAAEAKGVAATYWASFKTALEGKQKALTANAELEKQIASMKVTPAPKPVPPAPENPQAVADLKANGMLAPENLVAQDVPRVWTWCYKAEQVPVLERRAFDLESVLVKKDELLAGKDKELALADLAISDCSKAREAENLRANKLEEGMTAMKKEARAKEVKWWLKVGAAALVSYLAGKKL